MPSAIASIVEGSAEVESVPVLLRRIQELAGAYAIEIARPFRVKRDRIVKPEEIEKAVRYTVADRRNVGGVLVLLDADDDCPRELGPSLLRRCKQVTRLPIAVVIANKEFESWFLGSKESLRGTRGIRRDAATPTLPEEIQDAKKRLSQNMEPGRRYLEVYDQPALAAKMDFDLARRNCPSFDKFYREVQNLVDQVR